MYKEKFIRAWTDNVLHLGNKCTSRVESAHSALKSWVFSSTGALDTIFSIPHSEIENQVKKVNDVEESWHRHGILYKNAALHKLNG